jgi:hypothetical protein
LDEDPKETRNLAAERNDVVEKMHRQLREARGEEFDRLRR